MKALKKINDLIENVFTLIGICLLAILVVVVFTQVVVRNWFEIPLLWSTEVSMITFIWSIFLGSAVALRKRKHYIVEIFPPKYKKINAFLDVFADVACYGLIYIMIKNGIPFTKMGFSRMTTALVIPQAYIYVSIPISGVAMLLFNTEHLINNSKKFIQMIKGGDEDESISTING
ncbi:TRAP transporter small permease [Abyssisolibacter fermentans]|uniref:TRAP transporter small permease n=1 Tax=Abyssisolibacter fermentans TaxID=1766203 RepID=UPI000836C2BB|nr:TRAP transporter small permease [Abyssisolibacter fermentans]